jgi:hypothetical protein
MASLGFPNSWPSVTATGSRTAGAVQKSSSGALGFPNSWPSVTAVGYRTAGAVQKSGGITLAVDAGSFALNGQAVGLLAGRKIVAASGSFALTGQSVGLFHGYTLTAGAGSFVLNGQAVSLTTALDALARDLAWIKLLVEADEVHTGSTVTKYQSGTSTLLLSKTHAGTPFESLRLVHESSGEDTYAGSTSIGTLATMAAAIRALVEGDEAQTASLLSRYTKATTTPIITKTVTGTPLTDLRAVQ